MKTIILMIVLLWAVPGWAEDIPMRRIPFPASESQSFDHSYRLTIPEEDLPVSARVKRWEYEIISESNLKQYLNEGWEFYRVYTVEESGVTRPGPQNRAVVRRRVK